MPEARHSRQLSAKSVPSHLRELLKDLCTTSPVLGAAIFTVEGLPFVSYFNTGTEDVTIAAMVASLHSTSVQMLNELRQGSLKSIIIEGTGGKTVVVSVPPGYVLAVIAPDIARTGLVFGDAKRVARECTRLIEQVG